jgi:hypothetical protein
MPVIQEAIRQMLVNNAGGLPSGRISYGYRPQNDALPAVTYTLSGDNAETVGATPLRQVELRVNGVAETALAAAELVPLIRAACQIGTYDGKAIHAVVFTGEELSDPVTGISDEQEPSIATVSATVYYQD